jgi:hypothetical protein
MNIPAFFRFLNKKIEKYNNMATNPFTVPQPIVLIWVEDSNTIENPNLDEHS